MTPINIISICFGIAGVIASALFGAVALRRNTKTDDKSEGRESGIVLTEIGYIKAGVDDIKATQVKQSDQLLNLTERVAGVEQSTKSAHKRLDIIESKE